MFRTQFLVAIMAITLNVAFATETMPTDACTIDVSGCGIESCEYEISGANYLYTVKVKNDNDECKDVCPGDRLNVKMKSSCGFDPNDFTWILDGVRLVQDGEYARFEMLDSKNGSVTFLLKFDDRDPSTLGCDDWQRKVIGTNPFLEKKFDFRCTKSPYEYACKDEMVEICIDNIQLPCIECESSFLLSEPVNGLDAKRFEPSLVNTTSKCYTLPLQYLASGNNIFTLEYDGNDCPATCTGGGVEIIEIDYACDCFTEESQTTIVCEYLEPKTIEYDAQSHCGDSIVHMTYVVLPSDTMYSIEQSCEPREVNHEVLKNTEGCDSLVLITSFETIIVDTTFVEEAVCEYQSDTSKILTNIAGCDSIVMIRYELLPSDTTYLIKSSCDPIDENRRDTLLQFNRFGCDSLIITSYEVITSAPMYLVKESCNIRDQERIDTLIEANIAGCDSVIVIRFHVNPTPNFEVKLTPKCGKPTLMEVESLDDEQVFVTWEDTNLVFEDTETSITVANQYGCSVDTSFWVEYYDQPSVQLGSDRTVKLGEYVAIRPQVSNQEGLFFDSEEVDINQILEQENGRFQPIEQVTITAQIITLDGCDASDEIVISIDQDKIYEVYGPNVFSPNFDGINDYFTVFTIHQAAMINSLKIFDRWGNQVFLAENIESSKEILGWDGTYKGKQLNSGVFVYSCMLTFLDDVQVKIRGDFTILNH